MSVRADVETFRNIPIFSECEAVHLQLLAFSAVRKAFSAGETIVSQGGRGGAYLILDGEVELTNQDAGELGTAGPGALLGEVAMIGDRPYSLTATAAGEVETVRIDRDLFMRVAQEFPDFGLAVANVLAQKLDLAMGELDVTRSIFERARSFRSF